MGIPRSKAGVDKFLVVEGVDIDNFCLQTWRMLWSHGRLDGRHIV